MVFALLALFAVADTTLPAGAYGTWVNADTVTTKHEFKGPEGFETFTSTVLYQQLVVTDSTLVDTVVQEDELTDAAAYLFTTPYRVEDGRLVLEGDSVVVDIVLEDDTLTLLASGSEEDVPPQRFVRASAPTVPPDLIGTWEGGVMDNAGVVVGIRLTFRDGTATGLTGSEAIRFDMLGPFLVFDEPRHGSYHNEEMVVMRVGHAKVSGDRLQLTGLGDEPLYMVRVSPKRQ